MTRVLHYLKAFFLKAYLSGKYIRKAVTGTQYPVTRLVCMSSVFTLKAALHIFQYYIQIRQNAHLDL